MNLFKFFQRPYRTVLYILSAACLCLLTALVGISGLSARVHRNRTHIALIQRGQVEFQVIVTTLLELHGTTLTTAPFTSELLTTEPPIEDASAEDTPAEDISATQRNLYASLETYADTFNASLSALASGGSVSRTRFYPDEATDEVTDDAKTEVEVTATSNLAVRALLIETITLWSPLHNHLSMLLANLPLGEQQMPQALPELSVSLAGTINAPMTRLPADQLPAGQANVSVDTSELERAVSYARTHNKDMLAQLQALITKLEAVNLQQLTWLRVLRLLSVGCIVTSLGSTLIVSLHKLKRAHDSLANLEQRNISMNNLLVSAADVAELEHALKESELRTRLLIDAIPDGVCRLDRAGVLLEVKRPELFQYTLPLKDVLGKRLEDVLPAADAQQARTHLERLFETREPQHYEASFDVDGMLEHRDVRWVFVDEGECLVLVRDITEQVYTQQALETSEARALTILNAIPDAIGRFSRDGYYLEIVNQGNFKEAVPRLRLEGQHMKTFLPEASAARLQHYTELMYETGEVQQVRYHIDADDGTRHYRDALLSPLTDSEHVALMRDVTNQVLMARALEASEGRFREIAETIDAIFFVFDIGRGRFSYISPKYEQIFGHSRDVLYRNPQTVVSYAFEEDKARLEAAYEQLLIGSSGEVEYRIVTPAGEIRWLSTRTFVTPSANQVSVDNTSSPTIHTVGQQNYRMYKYDIDDHETPERRVIGSTVNITERKQAEQALINNESRLRAMMIALPDGLAWLNREGRYLEVIHSDHYVPLASQAEIVGKTPEEVLPEDIARRFHEYINQLFTTSELQTFEYTILIDDVLRYRDVRLVPFDEDTCIVVVRDITERKQADLKLERALEEQTVLLKEIHHRVKNNLQVIASLLMLQGRSLSDEAAKLALEESRKRVIAMATVHKTMYEKGSLSQVDFRQYLEAIVPNMVRPPQAAKVEVLLDLESIKLHIDQAIPCGLIINELLDNAFEHAFPEAGDSQPEHAGRSYAKFFNAPKQVTPQHVTIHLRQVGTRVQLSVKDNGIGLPAQLDLQTLDNLTSLGMSIVNTLASQIEGELKIQRLEQGTQVDLHFPVTTVASLAFT